MPIYVIFDSKTGVYRGIHYFFKAVLTSTHNLCFEQKYEKYLKIFNFSVINFSVYLNRHVLVMTEGQCRSL